MILVTLKCLSDKTVAQDRTCLCSLAVSLIFLAMFAPSWLGSVPQGWPLATNFMLPKNWRVCPMRGRSSVKPWFASMRSMRFDSSLGSTSQRL